MTVDALIPDLDISCQDSVRQCRLPGGMRALAMAGRSSRTTLAADLAVEAAIAAAVQSFPRPPTGLAGWQAAARVFAATCGQPATLLAVVLGRPFLAYVCFGGGFLVAHRDPGGSIPIKPPGHGVLVDTALTGITLCTEKLGTAELGTAELGAA